MQNRKRQQRILSILLVLSIVVSGNVFWALRRPGVTLAGDAMCGLEEHSHTEACYEETLVCEIKDEDLHTHEDACYEVQTIPASEEQVLVCELVEQPHVHTDACYSVVWAEAHDETVLICTNAEEGHTHGDGCYEAQHVEGSEEKTLTCELTTEPHAHVDSCYETVVVPASEETVTVCDIPELQHEHTEACFETALLCEAAEHVHSINCYADETADVETQLDWQAMFADYSFTDKLGIDLAEIAKTQIGYKESELNFVADADGTRHGYTRYGAWYGTPYGDWSAMFVSFCLNYAGGSNATTPFNTGADSMSIHWQALGLYASAGEYTPQAGDLVFFDDNTVGIVYGVYGDSITVIEGDVDDAVASATIPIADASIKGWGLTSKAGEPEPTPTPQISEHSGAVLTEEMLSSLSQYQAWAVLEESLVAPVSNMRTMALRANSGIALAEETGTPIDMRNMITKVEVEEEIDGKWTPVDPDGGEVTAGDKLRFTVSYEVPKGTLKDTNTIFYDLPAEITTVMEASGEVVDNAKNVVGYFEIIDNENEPDQFRIIFNEEYASKNAGDTTTDGQNINGSLSFITTVDSIFIDGEETKDIIFNDTVKVDLEVKETETVKGDVHVEKTIAEVVGNTIKYTITITSNEGTFSDVVLTDTMTDGLVFKEFISGTGITESDIAVSTDKTSFTATLPKMSAGGTYVLTYTAELPEVELKNNNLVNNKVDVQSTDEGKNEIKDSAEVDHTFIVLDKRATLLANGDYSWTIEVNKSKLDISGWTLFDTVRIDNGEPQDLNVGVVIKDSAGKTIYTGPLPYKFLEGSTDTYQVTYTTSYDTTGKYQAIYNTARLVRDNEPPDNPIEAPKNIGIGVGDPLKKTGDVLEDTLTTDANGKQWVRVQWTVVIDTKDGPIGFGVPAIDGDGTTDRTSSWYFMDKLDDDQYMTYEQLINAVNAFKDAVYSYAGVDISKGSYRAALLNQLDENDDWIWHYDANDSRTPHLQENSLYERFRVYIPAQIPKEKTITFSYECWAPYDGGKQSYVNRVTFNDFDPFEEEGKAYFENEEPTVEKIAEWPGENDVPNENLDWRDWGGQSSDSNVNLDYESLFDGLMCWRIQVNIPKTYKGDLTVIEHLPEGLTISSLQVRTSQDSPIRFLRWKNDGAEQYFQWYDGKWRQIPFEISGNDITFTVSAETVAYILDNIPQAIQNEGGHKLYFYIYAQIIDEAEWIDGEENHLKQTATFANHVTLTNGQGTEFGTDTQTQVITKDLTIESVDKMVLDPDLNNIVTYEVVLNKDGLDLDPNSNTLTVEDVMEYVSPNDSPIRVRLVPGSVTLKKYPSADTDVDFKYTYEELSEANSTGDAVNWTNKILLTIPDETPVKLTYRYAVTGEEKQRITLDNTCSITGIYGGTIEDEQELEITLEKPVALANITSVTIYKVEEGDYTQKLAGAVFLLYRYNPKILNPVTGELGDYEQVVVERVSENKGDPIILTTNEDGLFVFHLDHKDADYSEVYHLAYDTAYKLVEITPPEGYYLPEHGYEFYISSGEEGAKLTIPNPYTGHVHGTGDNIYIENERDTTEITVEKVWRDQNNQLETDAHDDIDIKLQLYQKTAGGEEKAYRDIVLNAANGWKETIPDLPKAARNDNGTKGETYFYYVEEIDNPSGYTVSYNNNGGINSGTITVTNTKAPGYELPETGGHGVLPYVLLGMTLIGIPVVYGYKQRRKHEGRGVR